ncbi:MAG: hypothetical protein IJT42_06875 [Treponema sp.]|nr:hypothetical protein [Treponema sp.]
MKLSKTSNIFKKMFKIVSLSTMALSLSLVSCGGIDEQDEKTQAVAVEAGKGVVNFSLSSDFARTIKPSFAGWEGITFTVKTSLSEKVLASGKSASELAELSVAVPEGEQTFTIEAYKGENLVLSDSKTVTVAEASTSIIAFELKAAESGKGSVEVSVTLAEGSTVKAVLSKTELSDAEAKTAAKGNGAISVADGKITKNEIDVGTYWLYFVVTTAGGDTIVFPEYVYVLNGETSTATKDLSVEALEELVQANFVSLDFAEAKQWNGVPKRTTDKGNVAAKVERTESNPYAGYLGKGFYLVNGLFAEYNSKDENTNSIGYTHVTNDAVAEGASRPAGFVKAVESEAIPGPFKFSVTTGTNNASRKIKIYVSSSKENLWDESSLVVEEALNTNSNVHTYLYEGAGSAYIGFGTEPDSDGKVYTAISSIKIATDGSLKVDSFPATKVEFTNEGVESSESGYALSITKQALSENTYITAKAIPNWTVGGVASNTASPTFVVTSKPENGKVSVAADGKVSVTDIDNMIENETLVIKATSADGNASASLTFNIFANVDASVKIATTKTELKKALEGYVYGNSTVALDNAKAFITGFAHTYSDVEIAAAFDSASRNVTFTISCGDAEPATVIAEYTKEIASASVALAKTAVENALTDVAWTVSADATLAAVKTALPANLVDATSSASIVETEANGKTVVVTVKSDFYSEEVLAAVTVKTYAYTETLAKAAVDAAVNAIKGLNIAWDSDAETTVSSAKTLISGLSLSEVEVTVTKKDDDLVLVTVTNTLRTSVKDESIVISSPYVRAGAYNISTNAVEGYTVDGVTGGKWSRQTGGSDVSQTHDKITITATIDSNGINLKNKDSKAGYMTFVLDRNMNLTFTDTVKKGIEIFSDDEISSGKLGADGNETTVTLSAGTYTVYGATSSSAKIKTLKFAEVTGAGVTGDLSNIPVAENDIALSVNGKTVSVGNVSDTAESVSYVWFVNNVKVSGASSNAFTLPETSVIGETYVVRASVTIDGVTYTKSVSVMYE